VAASRNGLTSALENTANITFFRGHARFASPQAVEIGGERLHAGRIFINVGGRALVPPMPGINDVPYLTNASMMDVDFLPRHLVIVGGSYSVLDRCRRVQAAHLFCYFHLKEVRMDKTVDVTIPVEPEAAAALADARNREAVGRLVSRVLRPRAGPSPLAQAIAELKAEARAVGLSDADIDAELVRYHAERRDRGGG
jgi:hypothetical protein